MSKGISTLSQRYPTQQVIAQKTIDKTSNGIRVAIPCIITGFNAFEQTVSAKPCITEKVKEPDGRVIDVEIPELLDVPICMPRSGGYSLTMPISVGDECLVIFADMCINLWWGSGGIQTQEEIRRHDLSDGFAILGTWSQRNKVPSFSTDSAKLVNESTGVGVEVTGSTVKLTGTVLIGGQTLAEYIKSFL